MDIMVSREKLLKPLQAITGVVDKKQIKPILSNVLLGTENEKLLLTGTDLEIELVGLLSHEQLSREGKTTVSAKKLCDICRTLPEGSLLHLFLEKNNLIVRAGESCFTLNTLPADDFPLLLSHGEEEIPFMVKQDQLKNLFAKTYFAMGQQDVRHYLNGSLLDISHEAIRCVAADGHRLALMALQERGGFGCKREVRVILPRKSVLELIRLLNSESDQEVSIYIDNNRLRLVAKEYTFTSKLINAAYPDYHRLIPKGVLKAEVEREVLKQALVRASILSNEKFRGVRFQLAANQLRITANNVDQEQAEEIIPIEYAGDKIEFGFNIAYLLDVVSALSSKIIRCIFSDPGNGVLIEPVGEEEALYVVMPMRL